MIETHFRLTDEERARYHQLISREEYRQMQDAEMTYFDELRQEGVIEGQRKSLKRLLATKFGPLSTEIEARIDAMEFSDELDRCFDLALTAGSLDEIGLLG